MAEYLASWVDWRFEYAVSQFMIGFCKVAVWSVWPIMCHALRPRRRS